MGIVGLLFRKVYEGQHFGAKVCCSGSLTNCVLIGLGKQLKMTKWLDPYLSMGDPEGVPEA